MRRPSARRAGPRRGRRPAGRAAGPRPVELRAMPRKGYAPAFAAAVSAASATVGPVIPPSTIAVLYAFIADVSVGRMFLAGIIPGILMVIAQMVTVHWRGKALNIQPFPRASLAERGAATWRAMPALVVPFMMIGGMRTG